MSTIKTGLIEAYPLGMSWRAGVVFAALIVLVLGSGFAIGMKYQQALVEQEKTGLQAKLDDVNRRLHYVYPDLIPWDKREISMKSLLLSKYAQLAYAINFSGKSKNCAFLENSILLEESMVLLHDVRKPGQNYDQYEAQEKERIAILNKRIANFRDVSQHFACDN